MKVSIVELGEMPHGRFVELVRLCETLGYDHFSIADEKWSRDAFVRLTVAAQATSRIGITFSAADPYTRHPALTAQATASVAEVTGGRLRVMLGCGSRFDALPGYGAVRPAIGIRESIELMRRLWTGERVTYEGEIVRFLGGRFDFTIPPAQLPPVWVAGRGRYVLRTGGQVADGVLIGSFTTARGLEYARAEIGRGLERAGRSWDDISLGSWLYVHILEREDDPFPEAIRRGVSHALWSSRALILPMLEELATDLTDEFRTFMADAPHDWTPEVMGELRRLIPRGLLDAMSVVGTAEHVAERLRALGDYGIGEVIMWPFPRQGTSLEDFVVEFAGDVLPRLRGRPDRGGYQLVD